MAAEPYAGPHRLPGNHHFFSSHEDVAQVAPVAAILLGIPRPQKARLRRPLIKIAGELVGLFPSMGIWRNRRRSKSSNLLTQRSMLVRFE